MTPESTPAITGRMNPAPFALANLVKMSRLIPTLALLFALTLALSLPAAAQTFTTLYGFHPHPDAKEPRERMVIDSAGNLYGTGPNGGAFHYGAVFELSPPAIAGGAWSEQVIHDFTGGTGGLYPLSGLVMDKNGILYGMTTYGGGSNHCQFGCGIAYQLSPPVSPGGAWSFTTIHIFTGLIGDGSTPLGALIMNSSGIIYGTTSGGGRYNYTGGGTVFQIQPSGSGFTETILYNFGAKGDGNTPYSALTLDQYGNLYGGTESGGYHNSGTVFRLSPPVNPGDPWSETIIYSFRFRGSTGSAPFESALVLDHGDIFGTAIAGGANGGGGTIFRLSTPSPSSGIWRYEVLYTFNMLNGTEPTGGLTLDPSTRTFYGTAFFTYSVFGCGALYSLSPPAIAGGQWVYTTLHSFTGINDGCYPESQLLRDSSNNYYGTTIHGGLGLNIGTVFEFTP